MPRQSSDHSSLKTTLSVGSLIDNDVVIVQPTVSKRHCRLSWDGHSWFIEDLGSTNGTFIDNVPVTGPTKLSRHSRVTLGRGIKLDIPAPPIPASLNMRGTHVDNLKDERATKQENAVAISWLRRMPTVAKVSVGVSVLVMLVLISLWSFIPRNVNIEGSSNLSSGSTGLTIKADENQSVDLSGYTQSKSQSLSESGVVPVPTEMPVEATSPYWAIMVKNRHEEQPRLLGTAIAIGRNRLLTTATIVDSIRKLRVEYPVVILGQSDVKPLSVDVLDMKVQPEYELAVQKLAEFEVELDKKVASLDSTKEPPLNERLEWSERFESIMNEIARTDIASIECNIDLPVYLNVVSDSRSSFDRLTLSGYPMLVPCPVVNDDLETFFMSGEATVGKDKSTTSSYLTLETGDFHGISIVSMFATDQDSKLIGVVVRQQPVDDSRKPQIGQLIPIKQFWK